ncbi:MAG: thioesterase family protein [Sphingopyxis sp.]
MAESLAVPAHAFTVPFVAGAGTIDALGHVNNAVWVQWIQAVAEAHWAARASVAEQARYIWVVVRHAIDYHRPLTLGQSVTAHSWVADRAIGAKFDRNIVFIGNNGLRHVTALTTWALVDRASGRPIRVPAAMVEAFSLGLSHS